MSIVVDLIILGIIALCTFIGYKMGLIKASIRILAFFIAIIIALVLYRPVAGFIINNTGIGDSIQSSITNQILPEGESGENVYVEVNDTGVIAGVTGGTVSAVAESLTVQIVEIGTLIVIFLVVKLILRFVTVFTDIVTKIPILKQFDKARRICLWCNTRSSSCVYNSSSNIFASSNNK